MARMGSAAELPAELQSATVVSDEGLKQEHDQSGVWRARNEVPERQNVRIAHVLAGDDGVEDVEVSVRCPHCDGGILLDVGSEDALQTAFSLLHGGDDPSLDAELSEGGGEEPVLLARSGGSDGDAELDEPIARQLVTFLKRAPVADAMEPTVCFVRADSAVGNLTQVFAQNAVGFAIVTDSDNRPVGVVTPTHLMRALFSMEPKRLDQATVADVMTPRTFCVRIDAPLSQAAELVREQGAQTIAVVGDDGKLVGVLEPRDVLRFVLARRH